MAKCCDCVAGVCKVSLAGSHFSAALMSLDIEGIPGQI